jgi:hypothetical protein
MLSMGIGWRMLLKTKRSKVPPSLIRPAFAGIR